MERIEGVKIATPLAQNSVSAGDSNTGSRLVDGVNFDEYTGIAGLNIIEGRKFADGADEAIIDTGFQRQKKF